MSGRSLVQTVRDIINPPEPYDQNRNQRTNPNYPGVIHASRQKSKGGGEEIPAGGWRGGEEIPEGGWRTDPYLLDVEQEADVTYDIYRTKDGEDYFEFVFVWTGEYYDIDIFRMPSYGRRSKNLHDTHRLPSDRGGHKICFGDPYLIDSLGTARKWAATWAECTMNYIRYGNDFPNN